MPPAGANAAWAAHTTGLDAYRADPRFAGLDGSGLTVAVIDTGIDLDHAYFGPDANRDGVADRIVYGYDFADGDTDASDRNGHGSNVSSIIASADGVNRGVASGANIAALKVFSDSGAGYFLYVERALQWVVANAATYHIAAVNLSLGDGGNYATAASRYGLGDELAALAAQGVIVVAADGNDFYTFDSRQGVSYPASDPDVIGVGAVWSGDYGGSWRFSNGATDVTTGADRLASFGQRSTTLTDVLAPGARLTGANQTGGTVTMQGTSQAAAYITGVATLAQSVAMHELGRALSPTEFARLLKSSADTVVDGDDENDNVRNTGATYSRVNVERLALAIAGLRGGTAGGGGTGPGASDPGTTPVARPLDGHATTVTAGATLTGVDFGNFHLATITGTVFEDLDSNGLQTAGELGLAGRTVFIDANDNGALDSGEVTTTTGADGSFGFIDLLAGDYVVRSAAPAGWVSTSVLRSTIGSGAALVASLGSHNLPPVVLDESYSVANAGTLTVTAPGVLDNDSDAAGDTLSLSLVTAPLHGVLTLAADGGFTYAADAGYSGADSFRYAVSDGHGNSVQGVASISVASPGNSAPVLGAIGPQSVLEGSLLALFAVASDSEGDAPIYSLVSPPAGATIDAATGAIRWTPADGPGSVVLTVRATDGRDAALFTQQAFSVAIVDVTPSVSLTGPATAIQGVSYAVALSATDPGDDTISAFFINWGDGTLQTVPRSGGVLPAGASHVYAVGGASYDITVAAQNEDGTFAGTGLTVAVATPVNTSPVLSPIGARSVSEGSLLSLVVSAVDAEGDAPIYSLVSPPAGATIDAVTGSFAWTPADGPDTVTLTVRATDSRDPSLFSETSFDVTIVDVAPTVTLAGPATAVAGQSYSVSLTASDPGADTISAYTITWGDGTTQVVARVGGVLPDDATHVYATGGASYAIDVTATNEDGTFTGTGVTVAVATPANGAPVLAAIADQRVSEGSLLSFTASAVDAEGDTPVYSLVSPPAGATIDAVTGSFAWTPADGADAVTVIVRATDGRNAALFTERSFTVVVDDVAPTVTLTGAATATAGQSYAVALAASDPGEDTISAYTITWGDGTTQVVARAGGVLPGSATHVYATGGTSYAINVTATNEDGTFTGTGVTVAVATPANGAPVLAAIADQRVSEGSLLSFTASAVDAEGDTPVYSLVSPPAGATIDAVTGSFAWTPADGADAVTVIVRATDGRNAALFTERSFTVVVDDVAPTVTLTGAATATAGQSYAVALAASDPGADTISAFTITWGDGTTQVVARVGGVLPGSATHVFATGGTSYTIDVTATNEDGTFTGTGVTVAVAVPAGANTAPVLAPIADQRVAEGSLLAVVVSATDAEGDTPVYSLVSPPAGATIDAATGRLTWTPADGAASVSLTVRATDGRNAGLFAERSFLVAVDDVAPTVRLTGAATTTQGQTYVVALSATDPGDDTVSEFFIDWGDGTLQGVARGAGGLPGSASHVYAEGGRSYAIRVAAMNEDGLFDGTGLSVSVARPVLAVTSLVTSESGVALRFNDSFDVSTLNLYDAAGYGLGAADVTLVGARTGAVRASLVLDADGRGFSLIKTGGTLSADSYTLNLSSGAAALHNSVGGLDGDADGTAGGNYVASFTVAASTAGVISIADFMRGPEQDATSATGLAIRLDNAAGITRVVFHVDYDPALLEITGITPGAGLAGGTAAVSLAGGRATITLTTSGPLAGGSLLAANLIARVPGGATYGAVQKLDLTVDEVTGGSLVADDAVQVVGYIGDADASRSYTAADASLVQRVVVKSDSGFGAWSRIDATLIADVDGNGKLTSVDASRISQVAAGGTRPEIPPIPVRSTAAAAPVSVVVEDVGDESIEVRMSRLFRDFRVGAPPGTAAWQNDFVTRAGTSSVAPNLRITI